MEASLEGNSSNGSFSQSQKDLILTIMSSIGLLSFCTCVFTIGLVFYLRLHRHFIYRLSMYQVVSSMLLSVDNILVIFLTTYFERFVTLQRIVCLLTAVLKTYFVWINLLLTIVLTLHFFLLAVCFKNFKKLEIFYVLNSVIFPLFFVWVPFINNNYGKVGAFCWIRSETDDGQSNKEGVIEQYTLLYGPCYLFLIIAIIVSILVVALLIWRGNCGRGVSNEEEPLIGWTRTKHKNALIELTPLLSYPIIFFVFNLFVIGRRIYDYIVPNANFKLALAHAVIMTSWGVLSSIALLSHMIVIRYVRKRKGRELSNRRERTNNVCTGENKTVRYTANSEVSTYARTQYLIPAESVVDRNFEN